MIKQRYSKTQDLKNNFYFCTDNTTNQIKLMKIIPVSESEAVEIMEIMPIIIKLKHPNILKIYDYFQGSQEQVFAEQPDQESSVQQIRCIYIIMEKPYGFIEQYINMLNKQQISSIYSNLKLLVQYFQQNQISGNLEKENIFLQENYNPVIYPEIKNIINTNKIRSSILQKTPQQYLTKISSQKQGDFKQLNFLIYQLMKQGSLKQQLQDKKDILKPSFQDKKDIQLIQVETENSNQKLNLRSRKQKIQQEQDIQQNSELNEMPVILDRGILNRKISKLKKISKFSIGYNHGGWQKLELKRAYQFIVKYRKIIENDKLRNVNFIQMSEYIKTRTDSQCKNFYCRLLQKADGISKVVEYSKKKLKTI